MAERPMNLDELRTAIATVTAPLPEARRLSVRIIESVEAREAEVAAAQLLRAELERYKEAERRFREAEHRCSQVRLMALRGDLPDSEVARKYAWATAPLAAALHQLDEAERSADG